MPACRKIAIVILSCILFLALGGCAKSSVPDRVEEAFSQDALTQEGWSAHRWMQDADILWDAGAGQMRDRVSYGLCDALMDLRLRCPGFLA